MNEPTNDLKPSQQDWTMVLILLIIVLGTTIVAVTKILVQGKAPSAAVQKAEVPHEP